MRGRRLLRTVIATWTLVACATPATPPRGSDTIRATREIRCDVYEAPHCDEVGPSPLGRCSRGHDSGGIQGTGYYAIQRWEPTSPDGVVLIAENELLRLADGQLYGRVHAIFPGKSPDREVVRVHTITGGSGRYAGASGFIRPWNVVDADRFQHDAVIHQRDVMSTD
jgi:hypothetical protein